MSTDIQVPPRWLHRYANKHHTWRRDKDADGYTTFSRPIGLVETGFDYDGLHFGGRADLHCTLNLEIKSDLSEQQLRNRILLVWTILRLRHPLLFAHVHSNAVSNQRSFVIRIPRGSTEALDLAATTVTSLQHYTDIDIQDFIKHVLNSGRVFDSADSLVKLFILPLQQLPNGRFNLRIVLVVAHMITDGLSMYNMLEDFIDLMNREVYQVQSEMENALDSNEIAERLPPAQEDLYPVIPGNLAQQRWFWAITRILRHVRKPLPSGFTNPLRREVRSLFTIDEKYADALDYDPTRRPPLNSGYSTPVLSLSASKYLQRLCREAKTSVGAGTFALVGLVMMDLYEQLQPDIPLSSRQPFIASFPLNPRPFFNFTGPYDSCMLAFSDGIIMPFLPSFLPLQGRFKLLAKAAHRQLRSYQKRLRDPVKGLDPHSPLRMMASNYLMAIERSEAKLPPHLRLGINPQGAYPANISFQAATCGVSSVGSVKQWVSPGRYSLGRGTDFGADFRSVRMGVRARDNEFLCGSFSDSEGCIRFSVSYDASAIDEEMVKIWEGKIQSVLEPKEIPKL